MRDEPSPHQFSHHDCQIGRDGHHAVFQVVIQLSAILRDFNNLFINKRKKEENNISSYIRISINAKGTTTNQRYEHDTHLVTQMHDITDILLRHFCSHRDLYSQFDLALHLLWQHVGKISGCYIRAVTYTHTEIRVKIKRRVLSGKGCVCDRTANITYT